jgi:phage-related protein
MAGFLPPVIAVLGASIGEFTAKMGEARAEMRTTEGSFAEAGALGKGALLGIGAVALGVGYESVKMAAGFDQAMEMVHTQAGASQAEVDKLKGSVLALAPAVGMGPEQLATGLYHIESAGFRGAQAMDILTAAAKLAQIGQSDFETTSQAVVGVMASQIKGVKDAADAGNLLNTTVGMGDMKMQQLAEAIGTGILPKAAAAGLSFEDVGSALATLTDNVTPANEAATRLGMTFSLMSAPTAKAQKAYESIGMTSNQLANDMRGPGGLSAALTDLQNHLNKTYPAGQGVKLSLQEQQTELKTYSKSLTDMGVPLDQQTTLLNTFKGNLEKTGSAAVKQSAALSAMFGGGKSSGTMLTLLGEMDRFKEKTQQYGTAASRAQQAQEAWAAQQAQFSQQIKQIGAQLDVWGVKLGNVLIPALQKFIGWVQTGAKWISQHKDVLAILAGVIAGLVIPAIYSMAVAFGTFTAALLTNPVFLVIAALAAGAYLIITHWGAVKHFFEDLWKWLKEAAGAAWDFIKSHLHEVEAALIVVLGPIGLIITAAIEIVKHWSAVKGALGDVWNWMKREAGAVGSFFEGIFNGIAQPIEREWNRIAGDLASIWESLTTIWNATGGKLVSLIADHMTQIKAVFSQAWAFISGIVQADLRFVEGLVRAGWDLVQGIFHVAWDGISGYFRAVWDIISGVVKAALSIITGVVKAAWDVIAGIFKITWTLITGTVNTALDIIKGLLKLFADLVTGQWGKLWSDAKNLVSTVWNDIAGIFSRVLGDIKNTVVGAAKNIWHGFTGAITDAISGVTGALKAVWGAVVGAFSDAGKWLWNAGASIINGLVGGIKSVIGDVKNTLGHLASDIVSWKGPPSKDAVLLWGNGQLLMQGLMGGIDSKTGELQRKLAGVSATIAGGVGGSGSSGMLSGSGLGGGVSSGNGVIVVVNVQGAVHSDAGIAKVVRQEVLRYQQRNSRNNLSLAGFGS